MADSVSRENFEPNTSGFWVKEEKPVHERLRLTAESIGMLVSQKNQAYGNSVDTSAQAFRLLFPEGIPPAKFSQALLLVRIWDKMMRIATQEKAFGENPFQDIAGYGILGCVLGEVHEGT